MGPGIAHGQSQSIVLDGDATGLRERQRQTSALIRAAALDLFEHQGVRATTVQQIADRAGVSARTFFRYFDRKEQAAVPGPQRLFDALSELHLEPGDSLERVVEALHEVTMGVLGSQSPELSELRRVRALMATEPELRASVDLGERELVVRLREMLGDLLPGEDPLRLLVAAEACILLWHLAWETWTEGGGEDGPVDPAAAFATSRATLAEILRGWLG